MLEQGVSTGRPYVVVSADAHAAPDDLDHFLSYVDPAHREAVAAFGDLSSTAMSMLGGHDPGPIDDPDPVRATAARRLAGMGVDIKATEAWLSRYSEDWVFAGDADGRRLAVLEAQGIQGEQGQIHHDLVGLEAIGVKCFGFVALPAQHALDLFERDVLLSQEVR